MSSRTPTIYVVEDVATIAETYKSYLQSDRTPCSVEIFETGSAALSAIDKAAPSVILLDVQLPDMNGLDILRQIKARHVPVEVIVVTSQGSINLAVEAMREGAFDFVVKPCSRDRLRVTVRNALDRRKLSNELAAMEEEYIRDHFAGFIGKSLKMQTVYRIIQSAAPSNATMFVTGESGTGKELCARALHDFSKRAKGPFVTLNCAAIPHDLLESELFGHVKGAFTGASTERKGAALMANGGTLFLDEICEMEPSLQVKMLRFLQDGVVQRVGEDTPRSTDIRIVCATNRDPRAEVSAGRFREDLFYRLHVVPIELPPLRERDDDVLLIARHFLQRFGKEDGKRFSRLSADVEQLFLSYPWPGNVRQLQNVMRNIVVLHDGEAVELDMLPAERRGSADGPPFAEQGAGIASRRQNGAAPAPVLPAANGRGKIMPLDCVIRTTIENAITACNGSIPRAATALKISPSTLYRRIQGWQEDAAAAAGSAGGMLSP
jgi:two-component system repressor protein LuxO